MGHFTDEGFALRERASRTLLHGFQNKFPIRLECEYENLVRVVSKMGHKIMPLSMHSSATWKCKEKSDASEGKGELSKCASAPSACSSILRVGKFSSQQSYIETDALLLHQNKNNACNALKRSKGVDVQFASKITLPKRGLNLRTSVDATDELNSEMILDHSGEQNPLNSKERWNDNGTRNFLQTCEDLELSPDDLPEEKAPESVQDQEPELTLEDILADNDTESIMPWGEIGSHELLRNGSGLDFTLDPQNESGLTLGSENSFNFDELGMDKITR